MDARLGTVDAKGLAYDPRLVLSREPEAIERELSERLLHSLSEEERELLDALNRALLEGQVPRLAAYERPFAEEGYLRPALAVLVLLIAIYVRILIPR